jgi:hypothetical protein
MPWQIHWREVEWQQLFESWIFLQLFFFKHKVVGFLHSVKLKPDCLKGILYINFSHGLLEIIINFDQKFDDCHIVIMREMILSSYFEDIKRRHIEDLESVLCGERKWWHIHLLN